ncbi:uncharacterized protein BT62DRAFT_623308 [Guyanagaster necrorhizus]|uniref:Uncharacterized protein n=1 Tax=Guyanagaster necrorhizus TaxID=856835 RepID=A0A9P7VYT5_9AGAR|nr:uncharacterized protein BT62DRAFT_623308 [Guyanagaster necrorhizus MCA 3950]KAG7450091.1 hypothetical protein BT62DRAFT_623308 [Guyanagaster necrorhizus MCA 3950]
MSPFPVSIWQSPAAKWHLILPTPHVAVSPNGSILKHHASNIHSRPPSHPQTTSPRSKPSFTSLPTNHGRPKGTSITTRSTRKPIAQPYNGTRMFPLEKSVANASWTGTGTRKIG